MPASGDTSLSPARPATAPVGRRGFTLRTGRTGRVIGMPTDSTGDRFTRFYFNLADVPGSPTFFGQDTGKANHLDGLRTTRVLEMENGGAMARLPFYGHFDVVSAWDIDDAALDTNAFSPNLGFERMQMAMVPFGHARPAPGISELYSRPVSGRRGAEGTTTRRLPQPPLPGDEYTMEAMLWNKYTTLHAGDAVDIQELAAWAIQLHPRSVQDLRPLFILMQGLLKDIMHDKLLMYSGEVLELREMLRHANDQAKADMSEMQRTVEELLSKIDDQEAKSKVKARFASVMGKLTEVNKKVLEDKHTLEMQAVVNERAAKEARALKKQKQLAEESAHLNAKVARLQATNTTLAQRITELEQSLQSSASERKGLQGDLLQIQSQLTVVSKQAEVRKAVTANWAEGKLLSARGGAGTPSPCVTMAAVLSAKTNDVASRWLNEAGPVIGGAALTGLVQRDPGRAASLLEALPEDSMSLYIDGMPTADAGAVVKTVLMKANEEDNKKLTTAICKALDALGPSKGAHVLAHTPSPLTARLISSFSDKAAMQKGIAQWAQGRELLKSATQLITAPDIRDTDDTQAKVDETKTELRGIAGKVQDMEAGELLQLLSAFPSDIAETLLSFMDVQKGESVVKEVTKQSELRERVETIAKHYEHSQGWEIGSRTLEAAKAVEGADFTDLAEKVQVLLHVARLEHGFSFKVVQDGGGSSDDDLVIWEEGTAEDGAEDSAEGSAQESGRSSLGGAVRRALALNRLARVGEFVADPVVVNAAGTDGSLDNKKHVKWGAVVALTRISGPTAGPSPGQAPTLCPRCGFDLTSGLGASSAPLEAVLAVITKATAKAAQSVETEEAVLASVVDELESNMEADADIEEVLQSLPTAKSVRVLAMLAGRVVKRLHQGPMIEQLRELKSYNKPPYKVFCITTALFVILDTPDIERQLGPDLVLPEGTRVADVWKWLRTKMEVNKLLRQMGAITKESLTSKRRKAAAEMLEGISHGDANAASKAVTYLRKWCLTHVKGARQ